MATLYWIQKAEDKDIRTEGYIGFTARDPLIRKHEHESRKTGAKGTFHIIAEGSTSEMLDLERTLRPDSNIGDNIAPGGAIGGGEHKRTSVTREKMRQARKGTTWDDSTKKKISESLKGKMMWVTNGTNNKLLASSEEMPEGYRRGRILNNTGKNNPFFGKKHSEETKKKMRKPKKKRIMSCH